MLQIISSWAVGNPPTYAKQNKFNDTMFHNSLESLENEVTNLYERLLLK